MNDLPAARSWVACLRPNSEAAVRLFCFPYAGGTAHIFRDWPNALPNSVEFYSVQLPGRGHRLRSPLFTKLHSLVHSAAQEIMAYRDKPFAFFGHSMGAVISFELTRYLRREHGIQPCQLFVSGNPAPQVPPREPPIYDLPQSEFLNEIRQLNGTPPELLDHPELMSLLIPMLRADFKLVQTYVYSAESPLDCPITAFGGLDDEKVTREDLDAWREQTTGNFSIHMLPGDHFFIQTYQPLLLRRLSIELQQLASRVRGSVDDPRGRIFD